MRLKKVTGCIYDELSADGINEIDMTDEQRQKTIDAICSWLKRNPDQLNYVMQDLIETFGDYKISKEACECCGDHVWTWIWDI
jgi:hypothetical protein